MILNPPIIRGQYKSAFNAVTEYFNSIIVPGKRGLLFVEDSFELHAAIISQRENVLSATAVLWKKMHDYQRWQTEIDFVPTVETKSIELSREENEYFSGFFDSLEKEHEGQMIEQSPSLLILDGSQFHVGMFRDEKPVRNFDWNSGKNTRGLMEQLMRLSAYIRNRKKQL